MLYRNNLGKSLLPKVPEKYIPKQRKRHEISNLIIDENSALKLSGLSLIHNYPFDRLLICQALKFELVVMTVDQKIKPYSVVKYL